MPNHKQLVDKSCNSEIHTPTLLKGNTKRSTETLRSMLKSKLQARWSATHQQPNHKQMARCSLVEIQIKQNTTEFNQCSSQCTSKMRES